MTTSKILAGLATLTLLDIAAATPLAAQMTNPFEGIYLGAHAGYGTSGSMAFTGAPYSITGLPSDPTAIVPVPGRQDELDMDGLIGGAHTGYNLVTPGNLLFGIEGDWTYLGFDDRVNFQSGRVEIGGGDGVLFQHNSELELEWQGTIRGRVGFVTGNMLFFATGGVAFLKTDWSESATVTDCGQVCAAGDPTFTRFHEKSETLTGGVVGGGVEVALSPTIIAGADYLYERFGDLDSVPFGHTSPGQQGEVDDIEIHKVRVRLSVKLGGPPQ